MQYACKRSVACYTCIDATVITLSMYNVCASMFCQGDTVDRISDQIELAATYVQHGGVELQKAVAYKRSSRKVSKDNTATGPL